AAAIAPGAGHHRARPARCHRPRAAARLAACHGRGREPGRFLQGAEIRRCAGAKSLLRPGVFPPRVRALYDGRARRHPARRRRELTAYRRVEPLGWLVFVELPADEAYAPLYASVERSGALLGGALIFAFLAGTFLARKMVGPIQALRAGAARIGGGDLSQRISIKTGDELEALADQSTDMAGRLQQCYADLEL